MTEDEKMHYNELGDQFREEDKDKDGKISLEEWLSMIFHDEPQEPEFEDGIENMYDTRMNHHELSEEEQAEMLEDAKNEFNSTDLNKDGKLTREEIFNFVKGPINAEEEGEDTMSEEELQEMTTELFKELDRDLDNAVSFEEFYKAHYQEPIVAHDMHEEHEDDHDGLEALGVEPSDKDADADAVRVSAVEE